MKVLLSLSVEVVLNIKQKKKNIYNYQERVVGTLLINHNSVLLRTSGSR